MLTRLGGIRLECPECRCVYLAAPFILVGDPVDEDIRDTEETELQQAPKQLAEMEAPWAGEVEGGGPQSW